MNECTLWEELKKTITPLKEKKMGRFLKDVSTRLCVHKTTGNLLYVLDLHGFTVENAYQIFVRFLNVHAERQSKSIRVITGKGKNGNGLIHKEIPFWLENPKIAEKIREVRWLNGGGSLEIILKKVKN